MAYSNLTAAFNAIINELGDPSGVEDALKVLAENNDRLTVGNTPPADPKVTDIWFDTNVSQMKIWSGSIWYDHAIFNHISIKNPAVDRPAIDISGESHHSSPVIKIKTFTANDDYYVTFGTTDVEHEYAWKFSSDEEFAWIYSDVEKIFTIDKDGVKAKELKIGIIGEQINVGEEITNIKANVNEKLNSSVFDSSPQIYYGNTAPTGTINPGSLWYDNQEIRLHVWHENVWIQPDRVEDTALKSAMHTAINISTDFDSLKNNLLNVLS